VGGQQEKDVGMSQKTRGENAVFVDESWGGHRKKGNEWGEGGLWIFHVQGEG